MFDPLFPRLFDECEGEDPLIPERPDPDDAPEDGGSEDEEED